MRKFPPLQVDLGDFGKHILTFNEVNIQSNLEQQLVEQASDYAWYDRVLTELKAVHKNKVLSHNIWLAEQHNKIVEKLTKSLGKKPTVKDVDAALQKDETNINLQRELINFEKDVDKIRGFLTALSQKHSNLKELSNRERAGLSALSRNVPEEDLIEKVKENRGRGHKTTSTRREREE